MSDIQVSISEIIGGGYNEFFHSKNFYRVVKGSRGSKKSKTAALSYVINLLKYPWSNLLVIRRFSNTNRQSTFTDIKWAAARLGVSHLFKYNMSAPEITLKETGQKILFRGLDDEYKITSITVDVGSLCWVWIEEAYQIENVDKFDTLVESIRGFYPSPDFYKQITLTFNPWNEHHWLKKEFFDEETKRDDVFADTTTFRDNEWLDAGDIRRYTSLYKTNPRRATIVCDGEWGVAEGLVFQNFKVEDYNHYEVVNRVGLAAHGMDFGFTNDPTTILSTIVDLPNKKLYVYREDYGYAMMTDEMARLLRVRNLQRSRLIGDGSEPRTIAELRSKGITKIVGAKKGPDSVMHGIRFMQDFEIIIHPRCEKTIEEFNTYTFAKNRNGEWTDTPIDDHNHCIDAIRYSLEPHMIEHKKQDPKAMQRALQSYV